MKYVAILKIFDMKLCGEWHSGSCVYYRSKAELNSREEAEDFLNNMQNNYYHNNTEQYQFSRIILSYDEEYSKEAEKFFKYM